MILAKELSGLRNSRTDFSIRAGRSDRFVGDIRENAVSRVHAIRRNA